MIVAQAGFPENAHENGIGRFDALTILQYVIKKGGSRGARHGWKMKSNEHITKHKACAKRTKMNSILQQFGTNRNSKLNMMGHGILRTS